MIPSEQWLTPSAVRILRRAGGDRQADLETAAGQLVVACLEEESLAGGLLREAGLTMEAVVAQTPSGVVPPSAPEEIGESAGLTGLIHSLPEGLSQIVAAARRIARRDISSEGLSSEHLLAATLQFDAPVCRQLQQLGVTADGVLAVTGNRELSATPISVPFTLDDSEPSVAKSGDSDLPMAVDGTGRVLDACLNRAREGIRVLEDYARFVLDEAGAVQELKSLRHQLAAAEQDLSEWLRRTRSRDPAVEDRDVGGDVGTSLTGAQEETRRAMSDIVHANARRVQESLRSLEEFGKLVSVDFAAVMKQLRYQVYTIHQQLLQSAAAVPESTVTGRRQQLDKTHVCVLVTESGCRRSWKEVVESCLQGGAGMIQLREKRLDDRELLERARWLADACRAAGALSIVNDRVDIAHLSGTDGVHLGQDDCEVAAARRLLGDERLIGLSTHSVSDIRTAEASSADYFGVGPVFRSVTKQFDSLAGLQLLREAQMVQRPWFAIGGISLDNLAQVASAGARRIAVSSAAIASDQPDETVRRLHGQLTARLTDIDC